MWRFSGTVVKVVDGDTLDVEIDLGFKIKTIQRLRLARINAPELKTPEGKEAASTMSALCLGATVAIESKGHDAYMRWISEVVKSDINLSDEMVRLGMAVKYG